MLMQIFTASQKPCCRKDIRFPHLCVTDWPGEAVPSREGVAREPLIVSVYPALAGRKSPGGYTDRTTAGAQATPVGVIWSA